MGPFKQSAVAVHRLCHTVQLKASQNFIATFAASECDLQSRQPEHGARLFLHGAY